MGQPIFAYAASTPQFHAMFATFAIFASMTIGATEQVARKLVNPYQPNISAIAESTKRIVARKCFFISKRILIKVNQCMPGVKMLEHSISYWQNFKPPASDHLVMLQHSLQHIYQLAVSWIIEQAK
jgi:hypothetical protein